MHLVAAPIWAIIKAWEALIRTRVIPSIEALWVVAMDTRVITTALAAPRMVVSATPVEAMDIVTFTEVVVGHPTAGPSFPFADQCLVWT